MVEPESQQTERLAMERQDESAGIARKRAKQIRHIALLIESMQNKAVRS